MSSVICLARLIQHGLNTVRELAALSQYIVTLELKANEVLQLDKEVHHGLYFIEHGELRIEHNADYTRTLSYQNTFPHNHHPKPQALNPLSNTSIGHLNARAGTMGRQAALLKQSVRGQTGLSEQSFRLARIGQGWVVGMIEECSGMRRAGFYVTGKFTSMCLGSAQGNVHFHYLTRTIGVALPVF